MKNIVCRILGHQEYADDVLETRPWDDPDFYGYDRLDFREFNCVRCGQPLQPRVAA